MENGIPVGEELRKYFYESGLNFLSSVPQRRIQEMILYGTEGSQREND